MNSEHTAMAKVVEKVVSKYAGKWRIELSEARQEAWIGVLSEGIDGDMEGAAYKALSDYSNNRRPNGKQPTFWSLDYKWNEEDNRSKTLIQKIGLPNRLSLQHSELIEPSTEDFIFNTIEKILEDESKSKLIEEALKDIPPGFVTLLIEVLENKRNAYTVGRELGISFNRVERFLKTAGLTEMGKIRNRKQGRKDGSTADLPGLISGLISA